jgi:hypothetical protein
MKLFLRLLSLIVIVFISACGSDKLPKFTVLQGLRVLAIESNPPEINFDGATFTPAIVNFTATLSDLYGTGRALSYNLEWCLDPGIAMGAIPTCVGNPTRKIEMSAQSVALAGTFLAPNFTGSFALPAINFSTATASSLAAIASGFSSATSAQRFNGLNLIVIYEVFPTASPSEKVSSFKRVVISAATKAVKNSNPSGLEIRQNGTEITSLPTTESMLDAFLPAAQAESYSLMNDDGSTTAKTETLETTWFLTGPPEIECSRKKECSTDGLFSMSRTRVGELNTFYIPQVAVPTARGRILIGVARDDRGGIVVKRYLTGIGP